MSKWERTCPECGGNGYKNGTVRVGGSDCTTCHAHGKVSFDSEKPVPIKNDFEFKTAVAIMRDYQTRYFKTKEQSLMHFSKMWERVVDDYLKPSLFVLFFAFSVTLSAQNDTIQLKNGLPLPKGVTIHTPATIDYDEIQATLEEFAREEFAKVFVELMDEYMAQLQKGEVASFIGFYFYCRKRPSDAKQGH